MVAGSVDIMITTIVIGTTGNLSFKYDKLSVLFMVRSWRHYMVLGLLILLCLHILLSILVGLITTSLSCVIIIAIICISFKYFIDISELLWILRVINLAAGATTTAKFATSDVEAS